MVFQRGRFLPAAAGKGSAWPVGSGPAKVDPLMAFSGQSHVHNFGGRHGFARRRIEDQAAGVGVRRVGFECRNQCVHIDDAAAGGHNVLYQRDECVAIKFLRNWIHDVIVAGFYTCRQPAQVPEFSFHS